MPSLEDLTRRIRDALTAGPDLGASLKLDLKGEGFIRLAEGQVSNDDGPADLTVRITAADLAALGKGQLDPMRAMISGRLKVSDMGLALRLQPKIQALFTRAV